MKTHNNKKKSFSLKKNQPKTNIIKDAAAFGAGAIIGATGALLISKKPRTLDKTNPDNSSIEMYETELENQSMISQIKELKEHISREQENNKRLLEDIRVKTKEISQLSELHKKERESNLNLVSKINSCNKGYIELKQQASKEKESNVKLSKQISDCNKEIIRMRGLVSKRPDISREARLRSTLAKFIKNK